jgi:basic amino acid/polyamine antiporter, APA family
MSEPTRLTRVLGIPGATVVGFSAMLGTGVFVVWAPALELAGSALLGAVILAGIIAAANAWSSVALAVEHPESGGAYAYGRIRVHRSAGILAGVAFVVGKSASAAAAALAIGLYLFPEHMRIVAVVVIVLALTLDLRGLHRSVQVSAVLVGVVVVVLLVVAFQGMQSSAAAVESLPIPTAGNFLAASALCFFAFAGYARITVLGEEVRNPRRTIPWAVIISLGTVGALYLVVALTVMSAARGGVQIGTAGVLDLVDSTSILAALVRIGVVIAAGAALLALLAGVGRMIFAMASHGDAPQLLSVVTRGLPRRAQFLAAILAVGVAMVGQVEWAIGVSAVSVLIYYSVAHLAMLRTGRNPLIAVFGLVGCLTLAGSLVLWGAG